MAKQLAEVRAVLTIDAQTGAVKVLNTYVTQESTDTTLQGNGATDQRDVTQPELEGTLEDFVSGLLATAASDAGIV